VRSLSYVVCVRMREISDECAEYGGVMSVCSCVVLGSSRETNEYLYSYGMQASERAGSKHMHHLIP